MILVASTMDGVTPSSHVTVYVSSVPSPISPEEKRPFGRTAGTECL